MKTKKNRNKYKNSRKTKTTGGKAFANSSKALATGGKVIASGGFGCVFNPALKCSGRNNRGKNMISKLLTKKHALWVWMRF